MVNVYTKNGNFNISESLMEAIKDNNPDLLMEKKQIKQTAGEKYEKEEIDKINKDLKNHVLQSVLYQFPQNKLNNEDLNKVYIYFKKYLSIDGEKNKGEKAHLKSALNSFLGDKGIKFTDSDAVSAIEAAVNNNYEYKPKSIKIDISKEDEEERELISLLEEKRKFFLTLLF